MNEDLRPHELALQGILHDANASTTDSKRLIHLARCPKVFHSLNAEDAVDSFRFIHAHGALDLMFRLILFSDSLKSPPDTLIVFVPFLTSAARLTPRWIAESEESKKLTGWCISACFRIIFALQADNCDVRFSLVNSTLESLRPLVKIDASAVLSDEWFSRLLLSESNAIAVHTINLARLCLLNEGVKTSQLMEDFSLLDELTYKVSATEDPLVASAAAEAMLAAARKDPVVLNAIKVNYPGILPLFAKWAGRGFDATVRALIQLLSDENENPREKAALVIQKMWRGCVVRSKCKKMESGFRKLQILFRAKQRSKEAIAAQAAEEEEKRRAQSLVLARKIRASSERMLVLMEAVPASEVDEFLQRREKEAAVKIQTRWRGFATRNRFMSMREDMRRERAARVLQGWARRWLKNLRLKRSLNNLFTFEMTSETRKTLSEQVEELKSRRLREIREGAPETSREQVENLHERVAKLLQKKEVEESGVRRRMQRCQALLASIEVEKDLILSVESFDDMLENRDSNPAIKELLRPSNSAEVRSCAAEELERDLRNWRDPVWAAVEGKEIENDYFSDDIFSATKLDSETKTKFRESAYWKHLHWTLDE